MVALQNINRTLDQNTKIADLMYGHSGNFVQRLRGSFAPESNLSAPTIQICQLKCGCWIIAPDGHPKSPTHGHFKIPHLNSFKM